MADRMKRNMSHLSIKDAALQDFCHSTILVKNLWGFIHCRDDTHKKTTDFPSKGKLAEAQAGVNNLLKLACDRRSKPTVLSAEDEPERASMDAQQPNKVDVEEIEVKPRMLRAIPFDPTNEWCRTAQETFFGGGEPPACSSLQNLKDEAAGLNHCLLLRNEDWRQHRMPKAKESHVLFTKFLPANLSVVSTLNR